MPRRKNITTNLVQNTEKQPIPHAVPAPEIDNDPVESDGLSIRHRSFVDAIVGPAAGNGSKAAEMAGFASENRISLAVTATRLLNKANIQQAIAHAYAKRNMTPEWALATASDLASVSMAKFVSLGPDGKPMLDWIKAAESGAIGHIREWREEGIDHNGSFTVVKRSFKLFDKQKAVDTILRLHGLLKDTVKVEGKVSIEHSTSNAMAKLMADPTAFEAATQLADRLKGLETSVTSEPGRN